MISIMTRASFNNNLSCWFIKAYRVKENKKKKSRRIQIQKAQDQYRHQEKLRKKKKKKIFAALRTPFSPDLGLLKKRRGGCECSKKDSSNVKAWNKKALLIIIIHGYSSKTVQ